MTFIAITILAMAAAAPTDPPGRDDACAENLDRETESLAELNDRVNRQYNGTTPFTADQTLEIHHPTDGNVMRIFVRHSSELQPKERALTERLKRESLLGPDLFRECGAFLFAYRDRARARMFTSNMPLSVLIDVQEDALAEEGILETLERAPESVKFIIHFHTHPGFELRRGTEEYHEDFGLLPSWSDLKVYRYFASLFSFHAKRTIPFAGIVLPMCEHGDEVFFEIQVDPDPEIVARLEFKKRIRELRQLADRISIGIPAVEGD